MTESASSSPSTAPLRPPQRAQRRLRWQVRLVGIALSLALALLLAEGLLRWWLPLDPRENSSWYLAHPVYRFRHRGGLNEEFYWGQAYHVRTNSRGLRENTEVPYDQLGRLRVVCLGDSFTFGNGVEYGRTLVRVLEQQLERDRPEVPWQVINLGVSAHGPSLEYLYYREEGSKYRPRIVVIGAFCGNDVADDARDKAFRLVEGRLIEVPYRIGRLKQLTNQEWYQWTIRRCQLLVRARQGYSWVIDHLWARDSKQDQIAAMTDPAALEAAWPLTEAVWTQFAERIRQDGAEPVFLIIPAQEQVDHQAGLPVPENLYQVAENTRQRLLKLAAAKGWTTVDLLPTLGSQVRTAREIYLAGDFHFNELGHRLAGEALAVAVSRLVAKGEGGPGADSLPGEPPARPDQGPVSAGGSSGEAAREPPATENSHPGAAKE